jgi:Dolichyl-phosphate-mannose-protein mannosyltransferase
MSVPLISDASEEQERDRGFQIAGMPWWAIAFLALTAAVSLIMGHYRLIAGDDFLQLWCDKVGSIGQLLHVQRTAPLVIDPFFYHGLTFAVIRLFGVRPFFLRLPSLLGFLLMQVCLFYFVRRIASARVAVFALAFPMITGGFVYTLQIRPYGVLLGLFGLVMLSWQTAVRRETHRAGALVVLALSIATAINTHYYGGLLMLPLCAGEVVRVWQRRRLDIPMLLAMGAGMSGILFLLPFLKGAAEFRNHLEAGSVSHRSITRAYNFIMLGQSTFSVHTNHVLAILQVLSVALVLWGCIRTWRGKSLRLPDAEFVFLLTLAALPVFAFLLGHFVTHYMEARYALGAVTGIAALLSIALAPVLRNRVAGFLLLALLFAGFAWKGMLGTQAERRNRDLDLATLVVPPKVMAAIMASPTQVLYTQDIDLVGFLAFHDADAGMLQHMALVYSEDEEMRWNHFETDSRIVENLKSCAPYAILPYERVIHEPEEHLFVVRHGGWNWLDKAFASGQVQVTPVGEAFGGEVVSVRGPLGGQGQRVP